MSNLNYLKDALALEATKSALSDFKYIIATVMILFFVGAKDDIIGTAPIKKLASHIIVALMIVLMANIRIKGMHGIFGVNEIPFWSGIFLSLLTIIITINAFNLIDGIDGLAAGIGLIATIIFGIWFYLANDIVMALLSFSLAGSLFAFLFFNFSPAHIFMGDTGSTIIGLMVSVLAIKVIECPGAEVSNTIISTVHRPIFVMAILSYPLIDTLRIFIYRTIKGVSPFEADRNHIHHLLLDAGMNHRQISLSLYGVSIFIVALTVLLSFLSATICFIIVFVFVIAIAQVPLFFQKKNLHKINPDLKNMTNGNGAENVNKSVKKKIFYE